MTKIFLNIVTTVTKLYAINVFIHTKKISQDIIKLFFQEYNTKCFIHKGENYEEFCYTCNRNICNSCFNEHKSHDRESLIGLDEEIVEGDISIIDLRKTFLENVRNKLLEEINQINSPSKQNNSEFNPNLKLTEILNENNQKTISNNKLMSFNNHFSFNNLIPFNQLKSFRFDSHSLSNDKLFLKSFSNESLVGIKPLSLIKTPRNNRYKFSQNYSLSENK